VSLLLLVRQAGGGVAVSEFPSLIVEVAFTTNPGSSSPVWTDISAYVRSASIRRGRQRELDRINAGTCTLELNNTSRRFDPTNTSSPYYPNVLPMRRLRVRASHSSGIHDLFSGYVERWPQEWVGPNVAFSPITVVDGFLALAKADVGTGAVWPQELSGARISRTLDAAGWPAADRTVSVGVSLIAETTLELGSETSALQHLTDVADSELGLFFCDASGKAVFHDRHKRLFAPYLTSQATFGDDTGELAYTDLRPDYDVELIYNDVRVTVTGGTTAQATDSTSQTTFFPRSLLRNVVLARDTEAADQAGYLISKYKDPELRFSTLTVRPGQTAALFEQVLGREISDRILVRRRPPGGGNIIEQSCHIESIAHQISPGVWQTEWLLSPAESPTVDWWLLGDATYGVLGTTTKTIY
jgi:hypothetical protein